MKKILSTLISSSLAAILCAQAVIAAPSAIINTQTADEVFLEETENSSIFEESTGKVALSGLKSNITVQTAEETTEGNFKPHIDDAQLMALLEGEGTAQSPYLISNAAGLYFFANNINTGVDTDKYYKLTADIDLGGEEWTPIGYYVPSATDKEAGYNTVFKGVFDGDGHTVSNFVITDADTPYIGFFGIATNATIKNFNIDGATVNVTSTSNNDLYASVLVGRVTTRYQDGNAVIRNCSVTNSTLYASGKRDVFAGAICGIAVAGNTVSGSTTIGTTINISLVKSNCDVSATSNPDNKKAQYQDFSASAGGILGYYGSQHNSTIYLKNAHSDGIITADTSATEFASSFAGGISGSVFVKEGVSGNKIKGGIFYADSCSSSGTAIAKARHLEAYTGGFTGYFDVTKDTYFSNCYSSVDCSADSVYSYICAGGLIGFLVFDKYSTSYPRTFENCYAQGDVIDLEALSGSPRMTSYVGSLFGYSEADIFKNTYKFESQTILGTDIFNDLLPSLGETATTNADSYAGFDFENIWEINPTASYPYPVLREKIAYATFINEDKNVYETAIGTSGKVVLPDEIPEKLPTNEFVFTFSHWSTEQNGEAFDLENTAIFEDTCFYAVYETALRKYTVNYYVDNEKFVPESVYYYNAPISELTTIPQKEDTPKIAYVFSHWSEIINGDEFDFTGLVCDRDYTFHAVFIEIDKTAWEGGIATEFAGGNGTAAQPYIIKSSEEFALLAKLVNEGNTEYALANYILEDNINLGNNYWTPIGTPLTPFSGVLDGNGYTIRNYRVIASDYAGLFGYILNGTVKNVVLSNYDISFSHTTTANNVFIGGVAGYLATNNSKNALISNVSVSARDFDVDITINASSGVSTPTLYAGGLIGYGSAVSGHKLTIKNCYTRTPVKAKSSRYLQLGGIAGHLWSGSGSSKSLLTMCYSTADLTGYTVNNSCKVGGLVGNISAQGKWTPDIDATETLLASDTVCMISNSFSVANISAYSEKFLQYSRVGRIVAECNENAYTDEETTRYLSRTASGNITVTPFDKEETDNQGTAASIEDLKNKNYLIQHVGFDFDNVWMEDDSGFPILKITTSDKPVFEFTNVLYEGSRLTCSVEFLSNYSEESTLVFTVRNARNQVIKLERINVTNSGISKEESVLFDNLPGACTISVSAIDKQTLVPLFPELESEL